MAALEQHTSKPQPEYITDEPCLNDFVELWKESGRDVPAFLELVNKFEKTMTEAQNHVKHTNTGPF